MLRARVAAPGERLSGSLCNGKARSLAGGTASKCFLGANLESSSPVPSRTQFRCTPRSHFRVGSRFCTSGKLLRHRSKGNLVKMHNLNSAVHDTCCRGLGWLPDPRQGVGTPAPNPSEAPPSASSQCLSPTEDVSSHAD